MTKFKPMLAASCEDIDALRYPLLATPKIDGIRCLIIDGVAMSRSLKPIPNQYIQSVIGRREYDGLDGELVVRGTFQDVTSAVMSEDGEPEFIYFVFDRWDLDTPYADRISGIGNYDNARIIGLLPVVIRDREQLDRHLKNCLAQGYEGTMVRSPDGPYKNGRATFREGYLTKIKPFEDDEAIILEFEEQMHNANEATTNALGHTERSSHKANLVPKGTLGALVVDHRTFGQFNIGTGFTDAQRAHIWANRWDYVGRWAKFRYQKHGTKDKPRIPSFLGFRDARDIS
jgi:DNA ligase-1